VACGTLRTRLKGKGFCTRVLKIHTVGRRGYTILEMLLTLFLVGGLLFTLALNNRQFGRSTEGRGIANATLAELRAARAYAQQNQTNVALAFSPEGSHFFRRFQGEELLVEDRPINLVSQGAGVVLWPDLSSADPAEPVPPLIDVSKLDGLGYILFLADGRSFSNGPSLNGNSILMTCVSYEGTSSGDRVKVDSVRNPSVVKISPTGSVQLAEESPAELENLPDTEAQPPLAGVGEPPVTPTDSPVIDDVEFSPKRATDLENVGLGRSFIEIHPLEETGGQKEFPTLTISVKATSPSAEPLYLSAVVEGSSGDEGFFSNLQDVRMEWDGQHWLGSLSWKPPYEAFDGDEFKFELVVQDRYGNEVRAVEHAGLKLQAEILPDVRLLICTTNKKIYLTNAQGGEPRLITPDGTNETRPFWSADGTSFFALEPKGSTFKLIRYTADGEERREFTTLPNSLERVTIDPSGFYVGYVSNRKNVSLTPAAVPTPAPTPAVTPETEPVYELNAVHISGSNPPIVVEAEAASEFSWSTLEPGALHFDKKVLTYPEEPADPPYFVTNHEFTNLDGVTPSATRRASSVTYPPVAGGSFSPRNPSKFALVKKEDAQPDKLVIATLDVDGYLVSETDVFQGADIGDLSWSLDGKELLVVKDGELFTVDAASAASTKLLNAAGKSNFRLAPKNKTVYYVSGGALKSWTKGTETDVALGLPDVSSYALTD
jgi:type II secretory pathway pseudopilin PulG